jgi:hypothetical protein
MFTGKLEGAWRVVARSPPRRLDMCEHLYSHMSRNAAAIWRQNLLIQEFNEIDWCYKAC